MKNIKTNRSQGQIIIGVLAIILVCGILMVMLFNKGMALREKSRLVHAADAVAYSEGVITARRLNFLAYTNRAMVVNNLAAGHAVNSISWLRYISNTWNGNPAFYNYFIPPFTFRPNLVLQPLITAGLNLAVPNLANDVNRVALFLQNLTLANTQLADAQQDALANSLAVNADVRNLVAAQYGNAFNNSTTPIRVNDPADLQDTINLANNIGNNLLANQLANLEAGNEDLALLAFIQTSINMAELEQLTLSGLNGRIDSDHWFNARDWRTNPDGNGRTKLFTTTYSNTNSDTIWQANQAGIQPLANGAVNSDWQATDAVTQADGVTIAFTGTASALALFPGYQHFPNTHVRLQDNAQGLPLNTTLSRTIFLSKDLRAQDINDNAADANFGLRSFDSIQHINDQANNQRVAVLTAFARAQVFYQRPLAMANDAFAFAAIPNGVTEFANLYSPFWQVRLVPVPSDF